ncbi:hypothetical protein SDC9_197303 [bioreactor metagenome]|uniref:Uncharacterized protein n=1 Tax=bioreactor metagenome TaxID=1076179 RepID=A0A645IEC7_9ZZZZ
MKVSAAEGNLRGGTHHAAAGKAALRPEVAGGDGGSPISLQIAAVIRKHQLFPVDGERPVHRMPQAEHAMPALQERHKTKRPHNVGGGPEERAVAECSLQREALRPDVQRAPVLRKDAGAQPDLKPPRPRRKRSGGEIRLVRPVVCNDLQGGGGLTRRVCVEGGDQRDGIRVVLLL